MRDVEEDGDEEEGVEEDGGPRGAGVLEIRQGQHAEPRGQGQSIGGDEECGEFPRLGAAQDEEGKLDDAEETDGGLRHG